MTIVTGQWMFDKHNILVVKIVFVKDGKMRTCFAQSMFSYDVQRATEQS